MSVLQRLEDAGIKLPAPNAPVANYVPFVMTGKLLFISGQISNGTAGVVRGRVGETLSLEEGQAAARLCAINLLAQTQAALGDLERVRRVVKLAGFVSAAPDFVDIPKVVNGCSDVMVLAFGDRGRHARSAVACPVLPMGAAVEVDAVIEFE
ncbi:MAG: RidA family protein [Alphaproteobacteria bacterium]|nr:RidA family protein [Alphaproteobacteria bacterium]